MALIVQKFGGTSVADIDKIKNVAQKVINVKKAGNKVVVVLSAMAGETDRLIDMAHRAAETPNEREYDSLISTGAGYNNAPVHRLEFHGLSGKIVPGISG